MGMKLKRFMIQEEWSESGDGYWISLKPGYCLDDDCVHTIHEDNRKAAWNRGVDRCNCEECRRDLKGRIE